jgi:hypothetical protein
MANEWFDYEEDQKRKSKSKKKSRLDLFIEEDSDDIGPSISRHRKKKGLFLYNP